MRVSYAQMFFKIWMEKGRKPRYEQYKKGLPQISFKKEVLPSLPGFLMAAVGNWGFV